MIEIKARARDDGWAFVAEGEAVFLLYPPYSTRRPVGDPSAVQRAVTKHGFEIDDRQFADWASVIKALSDDYVAAAAHRSSQTIDRGLIESAPLETLQTIVARVVDDLIPAGDLDAAEKLIADILASSAAAADAPLRTSAVDALRQLASARQKVATRADDIIDMPARIREFAPLATGKYSVEAIGSLAAHVRDRGLWSLAPS